MPETNEEKAKEFSRRVTELEKEFNCVLWAYSGTGDMMISFYDSDEEYEFYIEDRDDEG